MSGTLFVGVGGWGARAAARLRGDTSCALAVATTGSAPAPGGRADTPSLTLTRSVREFARIELPAYPCAAAAERLADADVIAPPVVTLEALRGALAAAPPPWLPPALRDGGEAWLADRGASTVPDAVAVRLLWPRVARSFHEVLARVAPAGPAPAPASDVVGAAAALVLANPADAVAAGLTIEVLREVRGTGRVVTVAVRNHDATDALHALLSDLESEMRAGPFTVFVLAGGVPSEEEAILDALVPATTVPPARSYRGCPLGFAVARATVAAVDPAQVVWHTARLAVGGALESLLGRSTEGGAAVAPRAHDLMARLTLPRFAALAAHPIPEIVAELRLPLAVPVGDAPDVARRRLDLAVERAAEGTATRAARYQAEADEWLYGGKISRLAGSTSPGFVPELDAVALAALGRHGMVGAVSVLATVEALLRDRGASAPRVQLAPKVREIELRRVAAQSALRSAGTGAGERAVAEYAKLATDLVRLRELAALLDAAYALHDRSVEALRALEARLVAIRGGAAAAREAVAEAFFPVADETVTLATSLAEEPALAATTLIESAAPDGASALLERWSQSGTALLDDLWRAARGALRPTASDLLERLAGLPARMAAELEQRPRGWEPGCVPMALVPAQRTVVRAPSEVLAGNVAASLRAIGETRVDAAQGAVHLVVTESGLPRFALTAAPAPAVDGVRAPARALAASLRAGNVGPEAARAALVAEAAASRDPYLELLAGTLGGAGRIPDLTQAERALALADPVRDAWTEPEIAVLSELGPIAQALRKALEVTDPATCLHYLEFARAGLEAWGRAVAAELVEPERSFARAACERHVALVVRALASTRGRAELRLELKTRRLGFSGAATRLEIEVVSHGAVPAEGIEVRLEPVDAYRIVGEPRVRLGRLPPGAATIAAFTIKPRGLGSIPVRVAATFADLVDPGREATLHAEAELFAARPGFVRIASNPYIAGPPVRTGSMFFGRDDVFQFVADNLRGRFQTNVLILHGNRRTGKSSILCQLERSDRVAPFIPVYLDLQGLGRLTTGSFLAGLAKRIARALTGRGLMPPDLPPRETLDGDGAFEAMNDFIDELSAGASRGARVLVMLDEFEILEDKAHEGRIDADLFGWIRAQMQHAEALAFVLAGTHRLTELDPVLWSPLLSLALYRHVGFLSADDVRRLVTEPVQGEVDFDDLALESILRLTAGHPYYAQLLCQLLVNQINERARSNVVTIEDLAAATETVLDAGAGQFSYEWSMPRGDPSRLVLAALAEIQDAASVWVELGTVAARAGISDDEAEAGARELVARDLALGWGGAYRVRADLLRLWLRREKSVARARAEAGR